MVTKEMKEQIIKDFGRTEGDTGSPEVQVAILTARTSRLTRKIIIHAAAFSRWSARDVTCLLISRARILSAIVL